MTENTAENHAGNGRDKIIPAVIEDEMKKSYLDYAMSVIVGRALPDVRDGLKPVHRRIIYAMNDMGIRWNTPYKKCARIVGEVLGKYHPHGDMAVYDSLVRMAQDFSLRYTLVDGQGNFGSIDGDNPAAMRYTEARLAKISQEMILDIDKDTVPWMDNFDGSLKEPTVLPSRFCNLLVNGSTGIAVGMATSIPPHNITEVSNGVIKLIDKPDATDADIMSIITAPDFPTGGTIVGRRGIMEAYTTGRGKVIVKSKILDEEHHKQKKIIITEIPYMVNKSELIKQIAELVKEKRIEGVSDLRDESDRKGMRIVIELKRDANPEVTKNQLLNYTRLQETIGIQFLALVNNKPITLTLRQIVREYLKHRQTIVRKRTEFDLKKAQERAHILEGLIIAINDIDNAIILIKKSKSAQEAKEGLMKKYSLTEVQSQAILDMRLQRLAQLEQEKIRQEHKDLLELIKKLTFTLADEKEILKIIRQEQLEIINTYGDSRKTTITDAEDEELEIEDLIPQQEAIITVSNEGYIKRMSPDQYKTQKRGGVGVIGAESKEEDFISDMFMANTHSYLLVFTNKGKVHWLKAYRVPEGTRQSKGRPIINLIEIEKDEKISSIIPINEFDDKHYLLIATKNGIVKKTELSAYSNPRKGGIIAMTLEDNDDVVGVSLTDGQKQVMLATKDGVACKFHEEDARPIGRQGKGVIGIRLDKGDEVIEMILVDDNTDVLTLTSKGYGKRTIASDYRFINRGGKGVININLTDKNGKVVAVKAVKGNEDLMLVTKQGMVIRTNISQIHSIGRNTQGVRVIKLREKDELVSAAKIVNE